MAHTAPTRKGMTMTDATTTPVPDYPLYCVSGALYTVTDSEYAGPTDEIVGSYEQVATILTNLLGEQIEYAGHMRFRTEYHLTRVTCWDCGAHATHDSQRGPASYCPTHAAEYDLEFTPYVAADGVRFATREDSGEADPADLEAGA